MQYQATINHRGSWWTSKGKPTNLLHEFRLTQICEKTCSLQKHSVPASFGWHEILTSLCDAKMCYSTAIKQKCSWKLSKPKLSSVEWGIMSQWASWPVSCIKATVHVLSCDHNFRKRNFSIVVFESSTRIGAKYCVRKNSFLPTKRNFLCVRFNVSKEV